MDMQDAKYLGHLNPVPVSLRVVIVNASPLTEIGLESSLRTLASSIDVLSARTPDEARDHLQTQSRCLVILDLDTPGTLGLTMLKSLRTIAPAARVVALSGAHEPAVVDGARSMGAAGYLSKTASIDAIQSSLRKVLSGSVPFVKDTVVALGHANPERRGAAPTAEVEGIRVTPKQHEVLGLVCRGLPNKSIGRLLVMQPGTVKAHVSALLRAYQARCRSELVVNAYRKGIR